MLVDFFIFEFEGQPPVPTIPPGSLNKPPFNCPGFQGYFSCAVSGIGYGVHQSASAAVIVTLPICTPAMRPCRSDDRAHH